MNSNLVISLKNRTVASAAPARRPRRRVRRFMFTVVIASFVIALGLGACFLLYNTVAGYFGGTAASTSAQVVARVGKLMLLPDEAPAVATVTDLNALKSQRFFEHAREGDIVLMYAAAQEAILYDPSLNLILAVAPITDANTSQQ